MIDFCHSRHPDLPRVGPRPIEHSRRSFTSRPVLRYADVRGNDIALRPRAQWVDSRSEPIRSFDHLIRTIPIFLDFAKMTLEPIRRLFQRMRLLPRGIVFTLLICTPLLSENFKTTANGPAIDPKAVVQTVSVEAELS